MRTHERPKGQRRDKVPGLSKQKILPTWIKSGIEDFYPSFELEKNGKDMALFIVIKVSRRSEGGNGAWNRVSHLNGPERTVFEPAIAPISVQ